MRDPLSVERALQTYFSSLGARGEERAVDYKPGWDPHRGSPDTIHHGQAYSDSQGENHKEAGTPFPLSRAEQDTTQDSVRALMLIRAYRVRGHLAADLDPLNLQAMPDQPELDPASYGFGPGDRDRPVFIDGVLGLQTASIHEILEVLKRTYCGTLGVQFMHISNPEEKSWIQNYLEGAEKGIRFTPEDKKAILKKLVEAESFEGFLNKRYPGAKRFGLDGAEAMVPALEEIIRHGTELGVKEIVIGMPHRGRLNVLSNVMGKPHRAIFHEFQGGEAVNDGDYGSGDVKYHLGASFDRVFKGENVHLSLTPNPSHLEAVDPVVLGKVRAQQTFAEDSGFDTPRAKVMPLLMHGDAAFAGQGVVAECFGLSGLKGHRTGGTIHFIVNNQIGFTTAPKDSRSSPYPSDVALMVEAPILHVNGDDPEAVVFAAKFATAYRQRFAKDVVLDMFCYRRFGHNEGDDPTFTQPFMYKRIKAHEPVCSLYAKRLVREGVLSQEEADSLKGEFESFLEAEFEQSSSYKPDDAKWLEGRWQGLGLPESDERQGDTAVKLRRLKDLGQAVTSLPEDFEAHRTVKRIYARRLEMIDKGEGLDWATAEALAFASLLDEGFPVRLSGQDSKRGTFFSASQSYHRPNL